MITKMKKYSFLVFTPEYEQFLKDIQNLGVLHVIEKNQEEAEILKDKYFLIKQFKETIKSLQNLNVPQGTPNHSKDGLTLLEEIKEKKKELDAFNQKLISIRKEIANQEPWGDFSIETVNNLKEQGVWLKYFVVPSKKFNEDWKQEYDLIKINEVAGLIYFVIVVRDEEEIDIEAEEVPALHKSFTQLNEEYQQTVELKEGVKKEIENYAATCIPVLENSLHYVENNSEFEKVILHTEKKAEDKIRVLEGWVPEPRIEDLNFYLEKETVVYIEQDPQPRDNPPILLQNNQFSKLFEPIGRLFMFPRYGELDLTPLFAPFFMMFFGFCLGDAGYGLFIVLFATLFKPRVKQPALKSILTLAQFLGVATVIFGALSGTFFGINLIEEEFEFLESVNNFFIKPESMFWFALILGGLQIVFGMTIKIVNIYKQKGFIYTLPVFGWLIMILGTASLYGLEKFYGMPMKPNLSILAIFSGVLILFFNNPKNIFASIGGGIWDVYTTVTGLLGDLLSYIRLFALGLSSAILGYVFNDLAFQVLSSNIIIVSQLGFLILLLFGHSINIFLAGLGAFVHPLRLTFVEFYKNAGFTGGGKEYKPFINKINQ